MSDGFSSAIGHRTVTDASVMTFGGLTGDYAQMHFDLSFGPASGMGESIAHGLLSAAWSLGAMTLYAPERLAIGDPRAALAGFEIRFGRMVHQGDRFSLRWKNRADPCVEGLGESATLDTGGTARIEFSSNHLLGCSHKNLGKNSGFSSLLTRRGRKEICTVFAIICVLCM